MYNRNFTMPKYGQTPVRPYFVPNHGTYDERGGFLVPFILGGITGGLTAPLFMNHNGYNQPYYYNNYYYPKYYGNPPYPYYPPYYKPY